VPHVPHPGAEEGPHEALTACSVSRSNSGCEAYTVVASAHDRLRSGNIRSSTDSDWGDSLF
jgi:hypothetical protein